jgi:hypothetical protein
MREEIVHPGAKPFDVPWTRLGWLPDSLPERVRTVTNTLSHCFTPNERSNPSSGLLVLLRGHSFASSADCELDVDRPRTQTDGYGLPRSATDTVSGHLQHPVSQHQHPPFASPQSEIRNRKSNFGVENPTQSQPVQPSPTCIFQFLCIALLLHFAQWAPHFRRSASPCKTHSRRVRKLGRSLPMNLPLNPSVILTYGSV